MRYTFIEEFYPGTCVNVTPLYTLWRRVVHVCLKGRARLPPSRCLWSRKYELSVTTISSGQLYLSDPCYFYSCNNTHSNGRHWLQSLFSVFDLRLGEPVTPQRWLRSKEPLTHPIIVEASSTDPHLKTPPMFSIVTLILSARYLHL